MPARWHQRHAEDPAETARWEAGKEQPTCPPQRPNPSDGPGGDGVGVAIIGALVVVIAAASIGLAATRDDPTPAKASGTVQSVGCDR